MTITVLCHVFLGPVYIRFVYCLWFVVCKILSRAGPALVHSKETLNK